MAKHECMLMLQTTSLVCDRPFGSRFISGDRAKPHALAHELLRRCRTKGLLQENETLDAAFLRLHKRMWPILRSAVNRLRRTLAGRLKGTPLFNGLADHVSATDGGTVADAIREKQRGHDEFIAGTSNGDAVKAALERLDGQGPTIAAHMCGDL